MSSESPRRPYRLKQRAEAQARTRLRITEAIMELHGTVGPARTTVSAIAERAGVQRATVYRHFPDEPALFAACSAHWSALHPPPDPAAWAEIEDPAARLDAALGALYAWFRDGGPMLANLIRDEAVVPVLQELMTGLWGFLAAVEAGLLEGRQDAGPRVAAALGHAVDPRTWRSLASRGLDDDAIRALMTALVAAA